MDVARLNLSHGAHAEHERIYQRIRTAAAETGSNVGIPVDLQGPKIRLAEFAEGKATLTYGERFTPPASLVEKAERGEIYTDEPALATA